MEEPQANPQTRPSFPAPGLRAESPRPDVQTPAGPEPPPGRSLRRRLFRGSILLIGLPVALLCAASAIILRSAVLRQAEATGASMAAAVAHDLANPLRADERETVSDDLSSLFQSDEVVYAAILLEHGEVYARLGETEGRSLAGGLVDTPQAERSGPLLLIRAPVRDPSLRVFGVLHLGYSLERVQQTIHLGMAAIFLIGALLTGGAMSLGRIQARKVTAPLLELARAARRLSQGEHGFIAPEGADDEVGLLAAAHNEMARHLRDSSAWVERQNRELEQIVRERTEELRRKNQALAIQNERVSEMNRLKSEFLANMSHELRTPLNAILALSELLRDEISGPMANEEQKKQAAMIHASGEGLLRLINDVLDLSRIEAGKMEIRCEPVKTADLLNDAIEEVRRLAQEKGLEVRTALEAGPEILLDADRVRQVVLNLLGNAIKFTQRGCVQVSSRLDPVEGRLSVTVGDTGSGIAPQDHEKVFHEFHQVDGSATRRHGGTGLGLAISRRLVRLMGGELSLQSDLGQGSVFSFWIPLERDQPEETTGRADRTLLMGDDPGRLLEDVVPLTDDGKSRAAPSSEEPRRAA